MFSLNEPIQLDPIQINLLDDEKTIIGNTRSVIKMEFNHSYKVKMMGNLQGEHLNISLQSDQISYIQVEDSDEFIRVSPSSVKYSDSIEFTLKPVESSFFVGNNRAITQVKCYITNLDPYFNGIEFNVSGWNIELKSKATHEEFERLQSESGFLITHEACITRDSNEPFKKEKLPHLIQYLHLLFTFCNGFKSSPFYFRGIHKSGQMLWYEVARNGMDRFKKQANWFDPPNIDFESFNDGFYQLFNSEIYGNHLKEILYWYVNGNKPGIDKSVILTHTCLELICWIYLTMEKKNISKSGFEKLSTADRFSLMLNSCQIPIEIPEKLEALHGVMEKNENLENACQVFSFIRNTLVRPSNNESENSKTTDEIFEAGLLGCRFIELFILHKSNYYGHYFDRINYNTFKGDVDPVPWA